MIVPICLLFASLISLHILVNKGLDVLADEWIERKYLAFWVIAMLVSFGAACCIFATYGSCVLLHTSLNEQAAQSPPFCIAKPTP